MSTQQVLVEEPRQQDAGGGKGVVAAHGPNGWSNMLNIGRYGTDHQTRAFVAYFGMGAGVREDIVYPSTFVDGNG